MRRLGHKPSPEQHTGLGPLMGLSLAAGPLPDEHDEPLPPALDQLFQDCVANASAVAICHAQWSALGRPVGQWPELASRAWLYAMARLTAGQTLEEDDGTYIHALFEAVADRGFPRETAWYYGPDHLSKPPDLEAARESVDQILVAGARRIVSTGQQRVTDVAAAIAGGSTVVMGSVIDQPFIDLRASDVWPGVRGTPVGGHAVLGHRYRTVPSTRRLQFALRSSWRKEFADDGSAWVDESAISSPNMSDLWILATAPQFSA